VKLSFNGGTGTGNGITATATAPGNANVYTNGHGNTNTNGHGNGKEVEEVDRILLQARERGYVDGDEWLLVEKEWYERWDRYARARAPALHLGPGPVATRYPGTPPHASWSHLINGPLIIVYIYIYIYIHSHCTTYDL
jgi:hypothetical protein